MKKTVLFAMLALLPLCAAAQEKKPAPAAGGTMELYLEAMDGQGWQWFFLADTVRRGIPAAALKVYPVVSKGEDGAFFARRGEAELAESTRLAVIGQAWPGKLLNYLNARSLSPSSDGWRDAALYAGINPAELERRTASEGKAALEAAHKKAADARVVETSLLLAGRRYEGSQRLMPLYDAVNASLPAARRVAPPAGYKPEPKAPPPGFWVVVSSGIARNEQLVGVFDRFFEGIKAVTLDYGSPERAAKFPELGFVPSYIIAATPEAKSRLANEIQAGLFVEKNGYLVYEDRQRRGLYAGRPEKKNTLEVFVMSQCPFGAMAENALLDADKEKLLPEGLDLQIHYIGDAKKDDKGAWVFNSLHGQAEWEENARQLFVMKKFPDKFRAYLRERNKEYSSPDWQKAAKAVGIDEKAVEAGAEEGKALLAEDFAATAALGLSTSPSFIVNGQEFMVGLGELLKVPGFEKIPQPGQAPAGGCAAK
jgi:2-hydroxychromene-2-carboxylate isomerase